MRLEQDQKVTEDARRRAEHELAAQKYEVHVLQVTSPPSYTTVTLAIGFYSIPPTRIKFLYGNVLRISTQFFPNKI